MKKTMLFLFIFLIPALVFSQTFPVSHNIQVQVLNSDFTTPDPADLTIEATILDGSNNWAVSEARFIDSGGNFYQVVAPGNGLLNVEVGNFHSFSWSVGDSIRLALNNTTTNEGTSITYVLNNANPQVVGEAVVLGPIGDAVLSLKCLLQGNLTDDLTVELRTERLGAAAYTYTVSPFADGTASKVVVPGHYYVMVDHPNHLSVVTAQSYTFNFSQTVTVDFTQSGTVYNCGESALILNPNTANWELRAGDISADDNMINATDYTLFDTSYGTITNDGAFNVYSDLNSDQVIDNSDFNIFAQNFGLSSCLIGGGLRAVTNLRTPDSQKLGTDPFTDTARNPKQIVLGGRLAEISDHTGKEITSMRSSTALTYSLLSDQTEAIQTLPLVVDAWITPDGAPDNIIGLDAWLEYDPAIFEVTTLIDNLSGLSWGIDLMDTSTPGVIKYSKGITLPGSTGWTLSEATSPFTVEFTVKSDAALGSTSISFHSVFSGANNNEFYEYTINPTPLSLDVIPCTAAQVGFSPAAIGDVLNFNQTGADTIVIANNGCQTLSVSNVELSYQGVDDGWMSVEFTPFDVLMNETTDLITTYNTATLTCGTYLGMVVIENNSGGETTQDVVQVSLEVTNPPIVAVEPTQIDFQVLTNESAQDMFFVDNLGCELLTVSDISIEYSSESTGWLSLDYNFQTIAHEANSPVTVLADANALPTGSHTATITVTSDDSEGNTTTVVNVTLIVFTGPNFDKDVMSGWNMVGLPLQVFDNHYLSVFPNANPNTLNLFDGTYVLEEYMDFGIGYWLKFPAAETVTISGIPQNTVTTFLNEGWNLIAGPSCNVPLSNVDDPNNIIVPNTLNEFTGVYELSDTIMQGTGYWLKAYAPGGEITATCGTRATALTNNDNDQLLDLNNLPVLMVEDANGFHQALYYGAGAVDSRLRESYSLPPIAPNAVFDVRYDDHYYLTPANQAVIDLNSFTPPLTITPYNVPMEEHHEFVLSIGDDDTRTLTDGEPIQLTDASLRQVTLSQQLILPQVYDLSQNYPNPFNPLTEISYALPLASNVELRVYNVAGQRVKTLVNKKQEPGYYTITWDSTNDNGREVSSGTYFYRMKSGEFEGVRKMLLLK